MHELTDVIDSHLAGYAEPDPARRRDLLSAAWTEDGVLLDPPLEGAGLDAIVGCGDAVVTHYPGHRFVRTTGIDEHHGVARYGWDLRNPDGVTVLAGVDIAEIGPDGRLTRIVGFFGPLPDPA